MVGPGAFIAAWAGLGASTPGYSPITDPISRLAADGAPYRLVMTMGLAGVAAGSLGLAAEIRRRRGGPAWLSLTTCGVATVAVAALPLGRSPGLDGAHGLAALAAYAALAGAPLLTAATAHRAAAPARISLVTGLACATSLVASLAASAVGGPVGLLQRLGLTLGDGWIMVTAWRLWRDRC
ncbi:MAG: DUF998 domain-containing protein [Acidimicrobiales bacterium]